MYLTVRKTKIGIRITFWCKMLTLKAYIPKRKYWKQRHDRRQKLGGWARWNNAHSSTATTGAN